MSNGPLQLQYDATGAPVSAAFAPVTARPTVALNSPQGGLVTLGSDYAATPKAQVPKVDANGSQAVTQTSPNGSSTLVYTGQPAPAAASQYGGLIMGRQDSPTPSTFYPLTLDPVMALNVHIKSKPTFRAIIAGVSCSTNKSLLSFVNAGTMVLRVNECSIYVPPQGSGGNLLGLGSATTYLPLFCELRRIASHTKGVGATVGTCPGDTSDVLDAGVTIFSNATIAGAAATPFHRQDALPTTNGSQPWYARGDSNEKTFVVRPGEGFSVTCLSNGTIASGGGTVAASVDIELTFTQAAA